MPREYFLYDVWRSNIPGEIRKLTHRNLISNNECCHQYFLPYHRVHPEVAKLSKLLLQNSGNQLKGLQPWRITVWPNYSIPRYKTKGPENMPIQKCIQRVMAALFVTAKRWKQPKCPSLPLQPSRYKGLLTYSSQTPRPGFRTCASPQEIQANCCLNVLLFWEGSPWLSSDSQ